MVIISDTAGMGKSTILTDLAQKIKEQNPTLWLVRIDLNNYTNQLKEQKEKGSFKAQDIEVSNPVFSKRLVKTCYFF